MDINENKEFGKKKWEAPKLKSLDFKNTNGGTSPTFAEDAFNLDGYQSLPS
jgi:hypothetical protein